MKVQLAMLIGLLGGIGMFFGDMILYYDKGGYKSKDSVSAIIEIMKKLKPIRLYIGGMTGPITAFMYCIGFYHIVLMAKPEFSNWAWFAFLVNCLGIICGSVYHAYVADLGLISRHSQEALKQVIEYLKFQRFIVLTIMGIGVIFLSAMIVLGWTLLPRWMVLFSPLFLLFLSPLVEKLPTKLHMIINGGWTNLIFVIYYALAILVLR